MIPPTSSVFWYRARPPSLPALQGRIRCDFAIVGGGLAGLEVARSLLDRAPESNVVLVESRFCGSGATGRSSGFLTPDSELQVAQLVRRFGDSVAARLWRAADDAVQRVRKDIEGFEASCDLIEADSLFAASGKGARATVEGEHRDRLRLGLESRFYDAGQIPGILGTSGFRGAARYGRTFGIDPFAYATALRDQLMRRGLRVFEDTPVRTLGPHLLQCPDGEVSAGTVFLCTDRFTPSLGVQREAASQVQTALAVTEPLALGLYKELFPEKPLMVWNTDLVYQYFRPIGERRLLVGGGLLRQTYAATSDGASRVVAHLLGSIREVFPALKDVRINHWWPGFIGVTKDFLPVAGRSTAVASHAIAICGTGLPWAMLAAHIATRSVLGGELELDAHFQPGRSFTDIDPLQRVAGKRATFPLSHYYAKQWLRGSPAQVAKRKRGVLALVALAAACLLLLWRRWR